MSENTKAIEDRLRADSNKAHAESLPVFAAATDDVRALLMEYEQLKYGGLKAYIDHMHSRHERTEDHRSTWAEYECDACKKFIMWDMGWLGDPTYPDVTAVKCWNCGNVIDLLDDEFLRIGRPDDWREDADETFPTPRELMARVKELESRQPV